MIKIITCKNDGFNYLQKFLKRFIGRPVTVLFLMVSTICRNFSRDLSADQ